jgi:hypothetical protein
MRKQVPAHDCRARLPDSPVKDPEVSANATLTRTYAETEAILREGLELERQGKLDVEATRSIEARLQAVSDRLDKDVDDSIAEIKSRYPTTPRAGRWQKIAEGLMLLAFVSVPLEFTVGESFVASFTNTYRSIVPLLFAVLLPIFAIAWFRHDRKQHTLARRYPTWVVRWMIMFPLIVVMSSSMVIFSPFGWSALAGWAIGIPSAQATAKVLSVEPMREPRRIGKCDQTAKVEIYGTDAKICIEGRVVGSTPKAGDSITAVGKISIFGFFVNEIRVQ